MFVRKYIQWDRFKIKNILDSSFWLYFNSLLVIINAYFRKDMIDPLDKNPNLT